MEKQHIGSLTFIGNFHLVFNAMHGWEYHCELLKNYGGVVRLNMLFGVKSADLLMKWTAVDVVAALTG